MVVRWVLVVVGGCYWFVAVCGCDCGLWVFAVVIVGDWFLWLWLRLVYDQEKNQNPCWQFFCRIPRRSGDKLAPEKVHFGSAKTTGNIEFFFRSSKSLLTDAKKISLLQRNISSRKHTSETTKIRNGTNPGAAENQHSKRKNYRFEGGKIVKPWHGAVVLRQFDKKSKTTTDELLGDSKWLWSLCICKVLTHPAHVQ